MTFEQPLRSRAAAVAQLITRFLLFVILHLTLK